VVKTNRLKSVNPELMELKRIVFVALDYISSLGKFGLKNKTYKTVFQIEFYNFLKRVKANSQIDPKELLTILIRNPNLVNFIKKKKFGDFMNAVRQLTYSSKDREIVFVTLYYEYYYKTKSVFSSALRASKYKLDRFDKEFVSKIFIRYPFLTKKDHLDHVINLLNKKQYACLLTQDGIKEVYDG